MCGQHVFKRGVVLYTDRKKQTNILHTNNKIMYQNTDKLLKIHKKAKEINFLSTV
jgi:hypothetical protein